MADSGQIREAIYERFTADWGRRTPIAYENMDYNPEGVDAFVRVSIANLDSNQTTIAPSGLRKYRQSAIAVVQVFVEKDKGMTLVDELANHARIVFQGKEISGAHFGAVRLNEVGVSNDPNGSSYYQLNVEAPFTYDERL